ncbi:hypothetical protein NDU88_000994 [Pleurodeles waltl]|uniref:Uncharacterized protein n=1 Tax=Pleurodeles waltl TaxID=8319 RepID=A0AAV7VXV7_PLEWA|nr:hypothetical protein NDU88_000994 [Pleurodeles waltl]
MRPERLRSAQPAHGTGLRRLGEERTGGPRLGPLPPAVPSGREQGQGSAGGRDPAEGSSGAREGENTTRGP